MGAEAAVADAGERLDGLCDEALRAPVEALPAAALDVYLVAVGADVVAVADAELPELGVQVAGGCVLLRVRSHGAISRSVMLGGFAVASLAPLSLGLGLGLGFGSAAP